MGIDNKKKIIPVVFATDENYIIPTYMAMYSMMLNAKKNTFFDIFVMIPGNMSDDGRSILKNIESYGDCQLAFLDMKDAFQDQKMLISYITPATYYRLLVPQLLPQYDRCIYLDSDVIVNKDISVLIDSILETDYLAGVVTGNPPLSNYKGEERVTHAKRLGVPNIDKYINAGILVFNLDLMRKDLLEEKFFECMNKQLPFQDQDILNAICYGRISFLNRQYNVCPLNKPNEEAQKMLNSNELEIIGKAYADPAVVHYAMPQKPWFSKKFPMAMYWWNVNAKINDKNVIQATDLFLKKNRKKAVFVVIKHNPVVMGVWKVVKKFVRK